MKGGGDIGRDEITYRSHEREAQVGNSRQMRVVEVFSVCSRPALHKSSPLRGMDFVSEKGADLQPNVQETKEEGRRDNDFLRNDDHSLDNDLKERLRLSGHQRSMLFDGLDKIRDLLNPSIGVGSFLGRKLAEGTGAVEGEDGGEDLASFEIGKGSSDEADGDSISFSDVSCSSKD